MGKYQNPKCDCGSDLVLWEEEMCEITTPITRQGRLSKQNIQKTGTGVTEDIFVVIFGDNK